MLPTKYERGKLLTFKSIRKLCSMTMFVFGGVKSSGQSNSISKTINLCHCVVLKSILLHFVHTQSFALRNLPASRISEKFCFWTFTMQNMLSNQWEKGRTKLFNHSETKNVKKKNDSLVAIIKPQFKAIMLIFIMHPKSNRKLNCLRYFSKLLNMGKRYKC